MPEAVALAVIEAVGATAAVSSAAAAAGTTLATVASVVGTTSFMAASAGYGAYQRRSQERKARDAYNASLQDRTQTYRGSDAARTLIYGETRANGLLTFAATHGASLEKTTLVLTLGGEPIDSFKTIWADDRDIGMPTGAPWNVPLGFATTETQYESKTATSTGSGFAVDLAPDIPAGGALIAVDSVVYIEANSVLVEWGGGSDGDQSRTYRDQSIFLRPPKAILDGSQQWTQSGTVVTITEALTAGKQIVITYRYSTPTGYFLQIKPYTGSFNLDSDLVDADLVSATSSQTAKWTSAHLGKGVPRLHATMTWQESLYAGGIPNFSAIVRGRRVYDPRLDSTNGGSGAHRADTSSTWAWSENPALCIADYLRYGAGATSSEIDWVAVATAASYCDVWVQAQADISITSITNATTAVITTTVAHKLRTGSRVYIQSAPGMAGAVRTTGEAYFVTRISDTQISIDLNSTALGTYTGGGTLRHVQKRYTLNGVVSTEADVKGNLEAMLGAMMGVCVYSGGKFILRAGQYFAPSMTLDESDLAEGTITMQAAAPRADLFNAVRGTFRDPGELYAINEFEPYIASAYVTEDGGQTIYEDFEFPFTDDAVAAQRLAKLLLRRSRQSVTFEATFKIYAYALQPGDTVYLKLKRYGWDTLNSGLGKVFRVVDREFVNLSTVNLTLVEEDTAVYDWSFGDATVVGATPRTALPRPSDVETPSGVAATSGYYVRADGVGVSYLKFTWALPQALDAHMEIYWKRAGGTTYTRIVVPTGVTEWVVENVAANEYFVAYFQLVNSVGAKGQSVFLAPFNTGEMPSGQPPVSANQLQLTTFDVGVGSLVAAAFNTTGTVGVRKHENPFLYLPGSPSSAYVWAQTSETGNGRAAYVDWPRIGGIRPGVSYAAYAYLNPWDTDAYIQLLWFGDDPNNWIKASDVTNTITGVPANARPWNNVANYGLASGVFVAPPGAKQAIYRFIAAGNWTAAAAKYCSIHKPFFGAVAAGTQQMPPWDSGGQNLISTGLLADGAATTVARAPVVDSASISFGNTYPIAGVTLPGQPVTQLTFTSDVDATVEIVVNFSAALTTPANTGAGIVLTLQKSGDGAKAFYSRRVLMSPTRSYTLQQAVSIETDTTVTAGVPVTIYCVPYLVIDSLVSGPVVTASLQDIQMKATLVKR